MGERAQILGIVKVDKHLKVKSRTLAVTQVKIPSVLKVSNCLRIVEKVLWTSLLAGTQEGKLPKLLWIKGRWWSQSSRSIKSRQENHSPEKNHCLNQRNYTISQGFVMHPHKHTALWNLKKKIYWRFEKQFLKDWLFQKTVATQCIASIMLKRALDTNTKTRKQATILQPSEQR